MASLASLVVDLVANTTTYRTNLDRARRDTQAFVASVTHSFAQVDVAISGLTRLAGAVGLIAGGAGLGLMIRETARYGSELQNMSQRLGFGVERLQELQYAARVTGASTEDLEHSLARFNRRIAEAGQGNADALKLFEQLGIAVTDSSGRFKDMDTLLKQFADGLKATASPAEQTRLAMEAFERTGTRMLPMLQGGAAGLKAFGDEGRATGAIVSAKMVAAAAEFDNKLAQLASTIKASMVPALVAMTPTLTTLADAFSRAAAAAGRFFSALLPESAADADELQRRLAAVNDELAKLEGQKNLSIFEKLGQLFGGGPGVGKRGGGGGFVTPAELDKQIEALKGRKAVLEGLLAAAQKPPTPPPAAMPLGTDQKAVDAWVKGWADAAQVIIDEHFEMTKALAEIDIKAAEDNQRLVDEGTESWIAAAEQRFAETEAMNQAAVADTDQRIAEEGALTAEGMAGWVAYAQAVIDATEAEQLAAAALPVSDFQKFQDSMKLIADQAALFGSSFDAIGASMDLVRAEMVRLLGEGFAPMSEEIQNLAGQLDKLNRIKDLEGVFHDVFSSLDRAITTSISGVMQGTQTIEQAFAKMGQAIALGLMEMVIKRGIKALEQALDELMKSAAIRQLIAAGVNALSGLITSSPSPSVQPVPGPSGGVQGMQHGGIVTQPTHVLAGEAGPEAIVPLSEWGGTSNVEININVEPGMTVESRERQGPDGRQIRDLFVRQMKDAMGSGALDDDFKQFGVARRGTVR